MNIDATLSSIDQHYNTLEREVGTEESIDFFTKYKVAGCKDNPKYLELNLACAKDVREQWEKWKANCSSQVDKIQEYDAKIKTCDGYLKLVENIVRKEIEKQAAEEQAKVNQIEVLLKRKHRTYKFEIPTADIEKAFELVKTLNFDDYAKEILLEIFQTYLNQKYLDYLKKAYTIAIYMKEKEPENTYFLDAIIDKCIKFSEVGEAFLADVLKYYPECNPVIIQDPLPKKHYIPQTFEMIQKEKIKNGDENAIIESKAQNLVDQGQFKEAFALAETIPDLKYLQSTLILLMASCIESGDETALKFAVDYFLSKNPPNKNNELYGIVEACKKNKLRDLAIETANLIDDKHLRDKALRKINSAREFNPSWDDF